MQQKKKDRLAGSRLRMKKKAKRMKKKAKEAAAAVDARDLMVCPHAELHAPHNPRELASLLAVLLPAFFVSGVHSAWAVGALALLTEFYSFKREPASRSSPLLTFFLPLILFRLLTLPVSDTAALWKASAGVIQWTHLVLFQCSIGGISSSLFGPYQFDRYHTRRLFCVGCTAVQFGSDPSLHLFAVLTAAGFDHTRAVVGSKLPGVFSNAELAIVTSLCFAAVTSMAAVTWSAVYYEPATQHPTPATLHLVSGGLVCFVLLLSCILAVILHSRCVRRYHPWTAAAIFYTSALAAGFGIFAPWIELITRVHPLWWVLQYLSDDSSKGWLLSWWLVVALAGAAAAHHLVTTSSRLPQILVRKVYHLAVIAMFVPGVLLDPDLLFLGYAVALSVLVLLEVVRSARVPPFGSGLDLFMRRFTDDRDAGCLITTHLYLLLGCALPHWGVRLSGCAADGWCEVGALAGVLVLGASDTAASVVGKCFGRNRWEGSNKTVEGTLGAICATVLCAFPFVFWAGGGGIVAMLVVWQCCAVCMLEAFTLEVDNLVLPIAFCTGLIASMHLVAS